MTEHPPRPDDHAAAELPRRPPSGLQGLAVVLGLAICLSGWAIAGMAAWEMEEPLPRALTVGAFVVLLPLAVLLIIRAIKGII
jgi:hypothetical protein